MSKWRNILIDDQSELFDRTGMNYLEFTADCRKIRSRAMQIVQQAPISIRELNLLEQQVSEIIKNAVKHGNKGDTTKIVKVWYLFTEQNARLIVEDQGAGFQEIEAWNNFHAMRQSLIAKGDLQALGSYVAWRTVASDEDDGGNALFAAVEYWNKGLVFTQKRNCVATSRDYSLFSC